MQLLNSANPRDTSSMPSFSICSKSRLKPTLLTRLTVHDSHWKSASSRHRSLEMDGNWTWAMQNLHPEPTSKQRWALMLCFHRLFSQCMSSSHCCPAYSSCASSGTVLNREFIHMKPAFVSHSHQRKWFLINCSHLCQIYFCLSLFLWLLEFFCSICWLYIHKMVKTKPIIVLPLQTGQRPPQLTVNKTTFHSNPDHFSSLVTDLNSP